MVDAAERLQVLLTQEENIYKTSDYLTRMQQASQSLSLATTASRDDEPSPSKKRKSWSSLEDAAQQSSGSGNIESSSGIDNDESSATQINKHWREKICEWAYQGEFVKDPKAMLIDNNKKSDLIPLQLLITLIYIERS